MSEPITGVSAVNDDGDVLLFCEDEFPDFEYFVIRETEILLYSDAAEAVLSRTYGPLTMDAVKARGYLHVQTIDADGVPRRAYRSEANHGL